jgi:hypothetical protein
MAVKGSGTGTAGPDKGAFVDQTSYDARKGAPKKPLTSFEKAWNMKDQNEPSGVTSAIAPIHPGVGPDASAADFMDAETPAERGGDRRRQPGGASARTSNGTWVPGKLNSSWGMRGGNGQGVDNDMSGKVLGESILSGSTRLPASTSTTTDSGAAPKYTGKDPN